MDALLLRLARPADLPAAHLLHHAAFGVEPGGEPCWWSRRSAR